MGVSGQRVTRHNWPGELVGVRNSSSDSAGDEDCGRVVNHRAGLFRKGVGKCALAAKEKDVVTGCYFPGPSRKVGFRAFSSSWSECPKFRKLHTRPVSVDLLPDLRQELVHSISRNRTEQTNMMRLALPGILSLQQHPQ